MKKILVGSTYTDGISNVFRKMDFEVYTNEMAFEKLNIEKIQSVISKYHMQGVEYVFTLDFFPDIARVTNGMGIKYISWIWDCPHTVLWAKEARYKSNYIFVFDYVQYCTHIDRGFDNIYYLPIAPDAEFFDEVIRNDCGRERKQYEADVTFVGNFYNDDSHDLFSKIKYLPPYVEGYLNSIICAQKCVWGADLLSSAISKEIWDELKKYIRWDLGDRYEDGIYEATMINVLGQRLAKEERMQMSSILVNKYDYALYSGSDLSFNKKLINRGYLDYKKQMPLAFKYSKININITIRSITSGIPLRVMDVLACGGFLITNYQPEIAEYFEDGKDLVIFSDFKDLCEKIDYYLANPAEREMIAQNGLSKVRKLFSLEEKVKQIVSVVEG